MTIRCELYDAGTTLVKVPHESPPGMDLAYYREIDCEYDFKTADTRPGEITQDILATEKWVDLKPWPEPFPGVMWIDYTPRYYGVDGGPQLDLYHWYAWGQDPDNPAPVGLSQLSDPDDHAPFGNREDERSGDMLTMEEVQERNTSPTRWIRMPTKNESGGTRLLQPATMMQRAQYGSAFGLESNYNPLFMPFDLRKPEYYRMIDDDGNTLSETTKKNYIKLLNGGYYKLYLMPAKWRWVASVVVIYIYISWFEAFYTRQIFTNAWFNRPPVYPIRHDVLTTSKYPNLEYNFAYYCSDNGVNDGFDRSRGSATLRYWIIDAQWYTMSEVYQYHSNDPVTLTIWYHPPDPGEVVLGIGRVDRLTGGEERLWLIQDQDVSDRWQPTVLEQYLVPFYVTV